MAAARLTGIEHERVAAPFISTLQAPHWPMPQPYLVPVRPIESRSTQSNGVSGSTSTPYWMLLTSRVNAISKSPVDLGPAQVVVLDRDVPDPLAGNLEHRVVDRRRHRRDRFFPSAFDPFVGLQPLDVDLPRVLVHADDRVRVEIAFDRLTVLDVDFLVQRIGDAPGDL